LKERKTETSEMRFLRPKFDITLRNKIGNIDIRQQLGTEGKVKIYENIRRSGFLLLRPSYFWQCHSIN
jgi:hypothetical protein